MTNNELNQQKSPQKIEYPQSQSVTIGDMSAHEFSIQPVEALERKQRVFNTYNYFIGTLEREPEKTNVWQNTHQKQGIHDAKVLYSRLCENDSVFLQQIQPADVILITPPHGNEAARDTILQTHNLQLAKSIDAMALIIPLVTRFFCNQFLDFHRAKFEGKFPADRFNNSEIGLLKACFVGVAAQDFYFRLNEFNLIIEKTIPSCMHGPRNPLSFLTSLVQADLSDLSVQQR
jgi:hypothetical protein